MEPVTLKDLIRPPAAFKSVVWAHFGVHKKPKAVHCKICLLKVSNKVRQLPAVYCVTVLKTCSFVPNLTWSPVSIVLVAGCMCCALVLYFMLFVPYQTQQGVGENGASWNVGKTPSCAVAQNSCLRAQLLPPIIASLPLPSCIGYSTH